MRIISWLCLLGVVSIVTGLTVYFAAWSGGVSFGVLFAAARYIVVTPYLWGPLLLGVLGLIASTYHRRTNERH